MKNHLVGVVQIRIHLVGQVQTRNHPVGLVPMRSVLVGLVPMRKNPTDGVMCGQLKVQVGMRIEVVQPLVQEALVQPKRLVQTGIIALPNFDLDVVMVQPIYQELIITDVTLV